MNCIYFLVKILFFCLFLTSIADASKENYFAEGKILFEKKKFEKSKIFFQKDIVFNPKNPDSYLYLAKISKKSENDEEEETNLNNVLLLSPQNDEAIFMLALLKIKQSNYSKAEELINKFNLVCNLFCSKENELQEKFDKLIPTNEKN